MWISRVRVNGGFLGGVDVRLSPGLNVMIGARGTGKTTLLELVRHALGGQHPDADFTKSHRAFLSAVLGSGEVIVDLEGDGVGRYIVADASTSGGDSELGEAVLVLGQNELEGIASSAQQRLRLIDLRAGATRERASRDEAGRLSAHIHALRIQIDAVRERVSIKRRLVNEIEILRLQEQALVKASDGRLEEARQQLTAAERSMADSRRQLESVSVGRAGLDTLASALAEQRRTFSNTVQHASLFGNSPTIVGDMARILSSIESLQVAVQASLDRVGAIASHLEAVELRGREAAAPVRRQLEEAEQGLGQLTSQLRTLEQELQSVTNAELGLQVLFEQLESLNKSRSKILDAAEAGETKQFTKRLAIATAITGAIDERVVVSVEHLSDGTAFKEFLLEVLRGSSTRTTTVDAIAERVLPRQLLEFVERHEADALAELTGMQSDRAERILVLLDESSTLVKLSQIGLADTVDFKLRDGAVEKSASQLSAGQKCAVTLPIVLSDPGRALILDQPEDHLDNAYLVSNVVASLIHRGTLGAQTIVATHNANIPVLGSAETVVVLHSDGSRGSVRAVGRFDAPPIVREITTLMEGGRDAFLRRASFYASVGELR